MQVNIKPYLPFLNNWFLSEQSSLNEDEISVIKFHIKNNFRVNPFQYFNSSNNPKTIQRIVAKLIWDFQKFKDWLITDFVFRLVKIARENCYNDLFLHLPLGNISLPNKLKTTLTSFKVKTFFEFFEIYDEKDLFDEINFKKILEFETEFRSINL